MSTRMSSRQEARFLRSQFFLLIVLLVATANSHAFAPVSWKQSGTLTKLKAGNEEGFWNQQQELMQEMAGLSDDSALQQSQSQKFAQRRQALLGDTVLLTVLIFSLLWTFWENPFISFSYVFGSIFGLAYSYGLGKYVETLGGSPEASNVPGAGVGEARFAFLILLFVFVGKFRSYGLSEIPAISGFFSYQLASLTQGLREYSD